MLLSGTGALAAEGYSLLADRVVVETAEHWQAWEAADGVRLIGRDGSVEPRFLRRAIDAVRNAGEFEYIREGDTLTGGIGAVGSNPELAPLVIDGDYGTWWEPQPDSPLEDWFVEVDLGRAVIAERIEVRFAAEGQGDPFLKFRVMVSDGRREFTRERQREFFRVGQVTQANKAQRAFVFPVEPQRPVPEGTTGEIAQFVRVEALATDGPRGAEVDAEMYERLSEEDRGAVDHYRRTTAGRQIRVKPEVYASLPEEERGEVRFFRRERPRLSEVQVYTPGDNAVRLTRGPLVQGVVTADYRRRRTFTDGLHSTYLPMQEYDPVKQENALEIDLGARYWLERIRLLSPAEPPPAYQVLISDGMLDPEGRRIWRFFPERQNAEVFLQVEERFAPQEARFIQVRRLALTSGRGESGNLSEVQAYGEGYVSEVVMTSPLLKLGRSRLFSTVDWEGDSPPGTRLEVRTRSGDELRLIPHYYGRTGGEVSQATWERIPEAERSPVVIEELPGPDWSEWSEVYRNTGESFKSPNPRRYALAEVRLVSQEPLRAATIRRLQLRFAPPLVDQVLAEIWPNQGVRPGEEQEFALYVRPRFGRSNPGFDRLRLRSGSTTPVELIAVNRGTEEEIARNAARQLWPGELRVEPVGDGDVELQFPEPVVGDDAVLIVRLRTRVFLSNTLFGVQLTNGAYPDRVQEATAGEAVAQVESQSLAVLARVDGLELMGNISMVPSVLTPNGDGVNDQVEIAVEVFVVEGAKEVNAAVFDLAGRRVRDLSRTVSRASGRHRFAWDGRNDRGELAPPGIYAVRLGLSTDARGGAEAVRLVHLVY